MATSGSEAVREFTILPGDSQKPQPTWHLPGSKIRAVVTGRQTEGKLAVFEQSMERSAGVPLHINHREDESFHLIEGNYRFEIAGILNELGPGSHVFIPRGIAHRFQYIGEQPGKMLIICQPAGIEAAFDELAGVPAPIEPTRFAAVCQKYGIEVIGPPLAAI